MRKCVFILLLLVAACSSYTSSEAISNDDNTVITNPDTGVILDLANFFTINFNSLENYENQPVPNYINDDNTPNNNQITNEVATLGRILFYDTNLSSNNSVSCASCHKQAFAF